MLRPTMASTSCRTGTWALSKEVTHWPSRRTTTRSAIAGDLLESVTDVDERNSFALSASTCSNRWSVSSRPEGGGRLIEDQQPRVQGKGLGDLDLLLCGDPQRADQPARRHVESEPFQLLLGAAVHLLGVDPAAGTS